MGDCTVKSMLSRVHNSESQFAYDLALYVVYCTMFESAGRKFVQVGSQFGLTVSILKTKGLAMGATSEGNASPVEVGSGMIEMVKNFMYLGSNLSSNLKQLVRSSIGLPKLLKLLVPLEYNIFSNCQLSINAKRNVYNAVYFVAWC